MMLWYFQRGLEDLRLETHYDDTTDEYLLTVHGPTGEIVERFTDVFSFRTRLQTLENELAADQWKRVGPPVLMKDGWKMT